MCARAFVEGEVDAIESGYRSMMSVENSRAMLPINRFCNDLTKKGHHVISSARCARGSSQTRKVYCPTTGLAPRLSACVPRGG